jgi:hypothetical protein
MGYIYDNVTGRIRANFLQGIPVPPSGFTLTSDPIVLTDILDSKRDILGSVIVKRDRLIISGSNAIPRATVGQIAIQKIDGVTLANKVSPGDNDPVAYDVENPDAFENKKVSALVAGADTVKIAAPPVTAAISRLLVFSPELQLLDGSVVFV